MLPRAPASASPTSEPEEQYEEEEQEEQCKLILALAYSCVMCPKRLTLVNADDTVPSPGSLLGRGVGGSQVSENAPNSFLNNIVICLIMQ